MFIYIYSLYMQMIKVLYLIASTIAVTMVAVGIEEVGEELEIGEEELEEELELGEDEVEEEVEIREEEVEEELEIGVIYVLHYLIASAIAMTMVAVGIEEVEVELGEEEVEEELEIGED